MNEHGRVGRRRGAYIVYADNPNTLCCPQILLVLQSPLCHAPHQKTLRSLCPASRHRGRSPEGGRKSRRRHSRRCSKTLCKASPEARSSPQPSQPLASVLATPSTPTPGKGGHSEPSRLQPLGDSFLSSSKHYGLIAKSCCKSKESHYSLPT